MRWLLSFELCPVQPGEIAKRIPMYTVISTDVVYLRSDMNYKIKSDSSCGLLLKSNLFYSCYIPNAISIWHIVGGQSILVEFFSMTLQGEDWLAHHCFPKVFWGKIAGACERRKSRVRVLD